MVVLSVTNCPVQLRGDLTKWFMEIDIGVYVGRVSARVRDKIWNRVCDNIKTGKAIMVYSSNTEQGFSILTHNTDWVPVDCEGILLMQKSSQDKDSLTLEQQAKGFSKASMYAKRRAVSKNSVKQYVILDVETTGLDCELDRVIEVGMLKIKDNQIIDQYQNLISTDVTVSPSIISLTGITTEMINENGITEQNALREMKKFIGNSMVMGYNVNFDLKFLNKMCERNSQEIFIYRCKDVLQLIRRKIHIDNYRLETVAKACGVEIEGAHRALDDCKLLYRINHKLNIF